MFAMPVAITMCAVEESSRPAWVSGSRYAASPIQRAPYPSFSSSATTYVHQHEIERACEIGVQALDLPSDQRIGPIDQRARDLLRELEPWRSSPSVTALAERLATP